MSLTPAELERFLEQNFPTVRGWAAIEHLAPDRVRLRLPFDERYLRPGGTLSGPTLMTLADTAMYYLVLANIGLTLHAVTASLNIVFLRRPEPKDLWAEASLLKLGKKLAVGDVRLHTGDPAAPVAQATATYAVPS